MMNTGPASKICVLCGVDCSARPREKDTRGRYICRECADAHRASRMSHPASGPGIAQAPANPPSAGANGDEEISLILPEPSPPPPRPVQRESDHSPLASDNTYSVEARDETALRPSTFRPDMPRVNTPSTCENCGYSLKGLRKPKCPECGAVVAVKTTKEHMREVSAEVTKWEYLRPVIYFLVGFLGLALVHVLTGNPGAIVTNAIVYVIQVPVGVAAFWLCCLLIFGFDAPMHLTALRLAGIYAIVDLVRALTGLVIPIGYIPWIVGSIVWVGMLTSELDLDIQDAVIYTLVSNVIALVAVFMVGAILF